MSQARRSTRRTHTPNKKKPIKHGLREIVLIFFCFVGLYLFVSLLTYSGADPGWSHSGPVEEVRNKGGVAGALFADIFFYLFGYFAYLYPLMVGYIGWLIYQGHHHDILAEPRSLIIPGIGFVLTLTAGCGLAIVHFMAESALLPTHAGGILGLWVGNGLVSIVDRLGATLILLAVFFTGVTLLTGLSWLRLMDTLGYHTLIRWPFVKKYMSKQFLPWFATYAKYGLQMVGVGIKIFLQKLLQGITVVYQRWQDRRAKWREERRYYVDAAFDEENDDYFIKEEPLVDDTVLSDSVASSQNPPPPKPNPHPVNFVPEPELLPSLTLLESVPESVTSPNVKLLLQKMKDTFASWQLEATVNADHPGPVLTQFEVTTDPIIEANDFEEFGNELAKSLTLKPETVRVTEKQPGVLSILMPNFKRQTIYLSQLLQTPEYQDSPSPLTVALGQDVSGHSVIIDLTRIPHILMASSDASEKNMAIKTLILSLLYKSSPTRVRFLMIDSTNQELSVYADLPHLLTPVMTDMELCTPALQWCVQEMERRYRLMASMGVRNIEDYNQTLLLQDSQPEPEYAQSNKPLYYIVVIINELSTLMTSRVGKQAEQSVISLTQKARAAGIRMILATRNPTVNVISGLIKDSISTRMAFKVNNSNESHIILGQSGAERLLGKGDMLYMTAGTGMPARVHSSFISNQDVKNVVADLKVRATPDYIVLEPE
jgi:S-DNA-T family DNA segregation ATPase FtsK/SpoIIIE